MCFIAAIDYKYSIYNKYYILNIKNYFILGKIVTIITRVIMTHLNVSVTFFRHNDAGGSLRFLSSFFEL